MWTIGRSIRVLDIEFTSVKRLLYTFCNSVFLQRCRYSLRKYWEDTLWWSEFIVSIYFVVVVWIYSLNLFCLDIFFSRPIVFLLIRPRSSVVWCFVFLCRNIVHLKNKLLWSVVSFYVAHAWLCTCLGKERGKKVEHILENSWWRFFHRRFQIWLLWFP